MNVDSAGLLGSGIYSVREASRLAGVDTRVARRWLQGYGSESAEGDRRHKPIVVPQHASTLEGALSFLDLIELRFVAFFRGHGVSLQTIRKVATAARDELNCQHPFTIYRFKTDGRKILAEIARRGEDAKLLDLLTRQYVMKPVVERELFSGLEFDDRGIARSWSPPAGQNRVVLDPTRQFGAPIVKKGAVATSILFDSYQAEGDNASRVARLFEVPEADVKAAVAFERSLLH